MIGNEEAITFRDEFDLPNQDGVKRIRAKFCEEKKQWAYPTSLKVAKQRGIKEDEWREMLGYPISTEVKYPTKITSWPTEMRFKPRKKPESTGQAAMV
jgi:hypothetical protein